MSRANIDHAAVVATAVMQIFRTAPELQRHQHIEELLRDEFAEVARATAAARDDDLNK